MLAHSKPDDAAWLDSRSGRLRRVGKCPRERIVDGKAIVPVEIDSDVMLVKVRINNKVDATMVLDTGASSVAMTRRLADRLGLSEDDGEPFYVGTASGVTIAYRVVLEEVRLGGARVSRVGAAIVPRMRLGPEIDGLLGNSFLAHFSVQVDGAERRLVLSSLENPR
jgi:clan AA aspartic protease (TIGR02281 family)